MVSKHCFPFLDEFGEVFEFVEPVVLGDVVSVVVLVASGGDPVVEVGIAFCLVVGDELEVADAVTEGVVLFGFVWAVAVVFDEVVFVEEATGEDVVDFVGFVEGGVRVVEDGEEQVDFVADVVGFFEEVVDDFPGESDGFPAGSDFALDGSDGEFFRGSVPDGVAGVFDDLVWSGVEVAVEEC